MDPLLEAKIQNIISEMSNQLTKGSIDSSVSVTLMEIAINRLNLLMTHIGYLEQNLASALNSNKIFIQQIDNLNAENQRLQQIAHY